MRAWAGRPRWARAPVIPAPASTSAVTRWAVVVAVALTPRATWLTTVSHTSGQWGCSGRRFQSLAANVSIGTPSGRVMRVVDTVIDESGSWGASASW